MGSNPTDSTKGISRGRTGARVVNGVDCKSIIREFESHPVLYGAVVQLGEHHTCTVGVAGSNPVSSTQVYFTLGRILK